MTLLGTHPNLNCDRGQEHTVLGVMQAGEAIDHVTTASLSSGVSKLSVQGRRGKLPGTAGHLASVPPAQMGLQRSGSSHQTIHSRAVSQENFPRDSEM